MPSIFSKVSEAQDPLRAIPSATISLIVMTFFSSSRRKFGNPDWIVVFPVGLHCLQNHSARQFRLSHQSVVLLVPRNCRGTIFHRSRKKLPARFQLY